jgi:hypothetical protein
MDRYTVVFLEDTEKVSYLAMNAAPFHPQGFGQHGKMMLNDVAYSGRGGSFKKRIKFADLPADCQRAVLIDIHLGV